MKIFTIMDQYDYEELIFIHDKSTNLKGLICIHDTTLGPALGGLRFWKYEKEEDAIIDVLRLARGMTYKAAVSNLSLGGGKAVIIGDPKKDKSEALLRMFGKFVESLKGRYITAEDVGISVEDMCHIRKETKYVAGLPENMGGSGDPSPMTARGVFYGLKAALEEVYGTCSFVGKVIALQGLGHVGYNLARLLLEDGARVYACDIDEEKVEKAKRELGIIPVPFKEIYSVECDIFSPCALGGILNKETIPKLTCRIVGGAANNQLKSEEDGKLLHEKGILYLPDYVINAGGLINVSCEIEGYSREKALEKVKGIYTNIKKVIQIAKEEKIPTYLAANRLAEERILMVRKQRKIYL
ncbi:MAG: Glu/Leu/Phe/Val family dehydrogenase [Dictyoglomaceae bacterium]